MLLLGGSRVIFAQSDAKGFFPLTTFSADEIGRTAETYQTLQDGDGVLFFAGRSLLSFDGERWSDFSDSSIHLLRSIDFGPDGKIWAADMSDLGWFERSADLTWKFHSLRQFVPTEHRTMGEIWKVFADARGATFVTENRVLRWNGSRFEIWVMPGSRKLSGLRAGARTLIHYVPEGIFALEADGPHLIIPKSIIGESTVMWAEFGQSGWLFGTSRGFFRWDGTTLTPFAPELVPFLEENRLTSALRLRDGRIVIGTVKAGAVIVNADGKIAQFLGSREGLTSTYVTSLFVDRDNQLWITTGSRIVRVELAQDVSLFDERAGLPRTSATKVARFADTLVVANEQGLFSRSGSPAQFQPVKYGPLGVKQFEAFQDGVLIAGYRGVSFWNGRALKRVYDSDFDAGAIVASRSEPGRLLVADHMRVVRLGGPAPETLLDGLPAIISSIAEDSRGRIWVGCFEHGVRAFSPGEKQARRVDGETTWGLPRLTGWVQLRAADEGTLFVFANEGAWVLPAGASRFTALESFPHRAARAVSNVLSQTLFAIVMPPRSNAQVLEVALTANGAQVRPLSLDQLASIGTVEDVYAAKDAAGQNVLWISGSRGVLSKVVPHDTERVAPRAPSMRLFVRRTSDNKRVLASESIAHGTHSLELQFATREFARRASMRIESLIDGIDQDWVPAGREATRELIGIQDGRYVVRARTVAATGTVSAETRLTFEVLPPWWRTRSALVLEAAGIVLVVFGGHRFRVRSLRRQNAILEAKVRERTEELERASAAKTEFVANMSHDIRNPLNGIVGLALALEDTRLDSRQQEIVATLRECTTYLSSLVDDVLDFASIEAGKVELRPGAFSPEDLLQSIVTTLKADTAERGASVAIDCDAALPPALMGDAGRIQQILVNYVSNALKYAGGEIRLCAKIPAKSPGEIEFSVSDRGPGITREEQAVLFTKFSRLDGARKDDVAGTGLGLAACRHLADLMGGSVGVVSEPGAGSRFFLRLPLAVAQEPAPASIAAALPNTTVLLVEDTDYNAWAASAVLAKLGLTCERARNGEEAVRLFGERRFNIVLLDRNLPDMDGTEVARRLRAMETEGPSAILLAVTAYCTAEDRQKCLDAGMDAFVGKPLTPDKLKRVLIAAGRRLLASATLQAEPEVVTTPEQVVDTSLLSYLADDDDPTGLSTQLDRFLAELDATTAELRAASAAHDHSTLASTAHRVLGQARMIGCNALVSVAASLEAAARTGNASACGELVQRVHAEIAALREALRRRTTLAQPV